MSDNRKRSRGSDKPIDRVRNRAVMLTVGTVADGVITGTITLSDECYIVKDRAIYRMTMADQIDPGRDNINIPNNVQLALSAGSESDLVARTLLTAQEIFTTTYFAVDVRDQLVPIALDIARNLLAAQTIAEDLAACIDSLSEPITVKNGATTVPAVGSLASKVNAFVQATHAVIQQMYDLPRAFVSVPTKGWPDSFTQALQKKFGDDHAFTKFAGLIAPFVKFLRNTRHCIEHRSPDKRIEVRDFHLTRDGHLNRPTVAIIHRETPLESTDIVALMHEIVGQLIDIIEGMIAQIADATRPESVAGLPLAIATIPEDQRRSGSRVRIGYFTQINNQWMRLG